MSKKTLLGHAAVWMLLLLFPLLFYSPNDTVAQTWGRAIRTAGSTLSYMGLFYVNYLWLVPRKLIPGKKQQFYLYNLLFIVLALAFVMLWWRLTTDFFPEPHKVRPPMTPDMVHPAKPAMPGKPGRLGLPPPEQMLIFYNIVSLVFTVGVSMALRLGQRTKELETERLEAERQRSEAELSNLRNQLNPHFLLNTLNNIYALISFDTDKAQLAVSELSKLLRHILYENQSNFVPLYTEAAFIENYVELMKIRVTDDVRVITNIDIAPDDATPVAPLLFISLIENAFKHGVSSSGEGDIIIELHHTDDSITCCITNSNHPKKDNDKSGSGIGLKQVARRLELLYSGRYTWESGKSEDNTMYYSTITIKQ